MRKGRTDIQADFSIAGGDKIDSIDTTLTGSDTSIPTGKAVKDITDANIASINIANSKIDKNQDNITLNAFRTAINGSLSQFGMIDGIVDEYEDELGLIAEISQPFTHMLMENNTDSGSGANAVTDIGSPTYTAGHLNNALTLDGVDQALNLDALQTDIASDTTGTFSVWFKRQVSSPTGYIIQFGDADVSEFISIFIDESGLLGTRVRVSSSDLWRTETFDPVSPDVWHHLVLVQDGISPKVYLDGVEDTIFISSSDTTGWFADATGIDSGRIGCQNNTSGVNRQFFTGQIDDLRYYQNIALTTLQVQTLYNEGNGSESSTFSGTINQSYDSTNNFYDVFKDSIIANPFAHFKMNDTASGFNVIDDGTGANDGTYVNNNILSRYTDGLINTSLRFNQPSSNYINIDALEVDIDTDTSGSFSVWINSKIVNSDDVFISFGDTSAELYYQMAISASDSKIICAFVSSSTQWAIKSTTVLNINTWYHIALIQDGVSPKLYINGVEETNLIVSLDTTFWMADGAGLDNGRIGTLNQNNGGNIFFFDGKIDDVRYYQNTVLTSSDVQAIYNSGNGTEDQNPKHSPTVNMTLVSKSFPAQAEADNARIVLLQEDVDSIILNTDLIASVSRDGGTTFTPVTLENQGEYETGRNLLSASVDISAQPAGTEMIYKLETVNNKDLKIHGTGLSWN